MPKATQAGKDPNEGLADDATLATDIGDGKKRESEQLKYYGGDPDDLDNEDVTSLDRGDSLETEDAPTDRGDEVEEAEAEEEAEEEAVDDSDGDEEAEEEEVEEEAVDDSDGDEEEEEEAESPDTDKADRGIPRSRFNEVNERMKRAEALLAAQTSTEEAKEAAAAQKYDFDSNEKVYMDFMLDGKLDEAAAKRREIREAERAEFKAETKRETLGDVNTAQIQEAVDSLARQAEELYPVLDDSHPDYDAKVVDKVLTFMRGYESTGMTPDNALIAGLADAIYMYDLDGPGDEVTESKVTQKAPKKGKPITKIKEKLDIQQKQGKSPVGDGKGSADAGAVVPDISQMTDEEIDALPAKTLARLRGDFPE